MVLSRQVVPNWKDASGGKEGLRDSSPQHYSPPDYYQDCSSLGPLTTKDEEVVCIVLVVVVLERYIPGGHLVRSCLV